MISELKIDAHEVLSVVCKDLAKEILRARVKEFHAVEVEAEVSGIRLYSDWMSDASFGESKVDNVTPFRIISYLSLLEHLVQDIMTDEGDICEEYHEDHRRHLQELRAFATAVLAALDRTTFPT